MRQFSVREPAFWEAWPAHLKHLQDDYRSLGGGLATYFLGPEDPASPAIVALGMAPGFTLSRHSHSCHRFEIVMEGSFDAGRGNVVTTGDAMISAPFISYGPHVAGPGGSKSLEIFGDYKASYTQALQTPDGVFHCDSSTVAGYAEYRAVQRKYAMSMVEARAMQDSLGAAPDGGVPDQHFLSPRDPAFWTNCPAERADLRALMQARPGRLAFFRMGGAADKLPYVAVIKLDPGECLAAESRHGNRFKALVTGSTSTLPAGSVIDAAPGEVTPPLTAGSDGALLYEIFADLRDIAPRYASARFTKQAI